MRLPRELAEDVWYEVRTAVNVGEPLFRLGWAVALFYRVLREAKGKFGFEMRGLAVEGVWLFYIKPVYGLKLPKIMQWLKQTFSVRFNFRTGRTRAWREWKMDNVVFWRWRVPFLSFSILHFPFSIPRRGGAAPARLD
ncbi:MAG: hypothetical protein LBT00_01740 [Spirochaetaceae bacterium]|jgi:hypothetical protein|nr:hypothetical protein [Spirochaetaceae bacterium]